MSEDRYNWTEGLEEGDSVVIVNPKGLKVITIVQRVTLNTIYAQGLPFKRTTGKSPGNSFYDYYLKSFKPSSGSKDKEERKRKIICRKLAKFDYSKLTYSQVKTIYAYIKNGESSNGN